MSAAVEPPPPVAVGRVVVNGLSIAYRRAGVGPPLLLLHGFSQDSRAWRPQLEGLSDRFTVLAWDAPGAGASADPPETFEIADWAECLVAFLDGVGVGRSDVVGLSWGGLLAQELWRRRPERIRSLVLADTYAGWAGSLPQPVPEERLAACLRDSQLQPSAFVDRYLPGMLSETAAADLRAELGAVMREFHPIGFRLMATALARADTRHLLATIGVPTLLLWGDRDARSPLHVGRQLEAGIPGARLVVIRGAGHISNLERPVEFNAAVRAFCEDVGGT